MDLFDAAPSADGVKLGFRLERLEVYNWGTFDEKVWSLQLDGDAALLTGDVGSGKSTLVDALITLLVPPRKATYNKAADASAKERSLTSYVRGYFGQKRTAEGGGQPESLRDTSQYSVVAAVFRDVNIGAAVTLAQFFWFAAEQRWPARFFVTADKPLSIAEHFSNFGAEVKVLKKRLSRDAAVKVYDDYPPYAREFRRRFGIRQAQALDLFQQTISMKKVDELTGFVRQNMLEAPDTKDEVKMLLAHFHDLDAAHHAVVKARRQQGLLRPIAQLGDAYFALADWSARLRQMQNALRPWFAEMANRFLAEEKTFLQRNLEQEREKKRVCSDAAKETERSLERVARRIAQSGGQQMETLRQELQSGGENLGVRRGAYSQYHQQTKLLGFPEAADAAAFAANRSNLAAKIAAEQAIGETLAEELSERGLSCGEVEKQRQQTAEELESLRQRRSSIPREYVETRSALCKSLDLAESELPFVGELLEVRAEEAEWEGAIERLLRGFGISLLIPDVHYGEVVEWMERTSLRLRMVYYRVKEDGGADAPPAEADRRTAAGKLNLRWDSPFCGWLARELRQRFSHACCASMAEFRRESYALTRSGQVKVGGKRHEKDDRHAIGDRRQYVLGFSNQRKIAVLEEELAVQQSEVKRWKKLMRETKDLQKENQQRLAAAAFLQSFAEFSAIDVHSLERELAKKREMLAALERENDVLQLLRQEQAELMLRREKTAQEMEACSRGIHRAELLLHQNGDQAAANAAIAAQLSEDAREAAYPRLEENLPLALPGCEVTLKTAARLENDYAAWLSGEFDRNQAQLEVKSVALTARMAEYINAYPQESSSLDASPAALSEYKFLLHKLETDGLPRFEEKFRLLLRENTINQIALFQGKLDLACRVIKERIDRINQSLQAIDYNPGRYIQIEYNQAFDAEIRDFRANLRACTDSILTGTEDEQYSEAKFLQVREIVERFRGRPGSAELDAKWMDKVIDVRNWYAFAASERWRETDEEYEHYTDSGGKSGGQKEKLAYTILAASLAYNFGLESRDKSVHSFRFVVIDEAFLKSSDDSARFGLELFKKLDLQLLVVTPLLKIATIEPYVSHVGFVYQNDEQHRSSLRNLTIRELQAERADYLEAHHGS